MIFNDFYFSDSNLIDSQQNIAFINGTLIQHKTNIVSSDMPNDSIDREGVRYLNPNLVTSSISTELNQWGLLTNTTNKTNDDTINNCINSVVIDHKIDRSINPNNSIEHLINKIPSSRSLNAKRCPTNKCECKDKNKCTKECIKSIGCHQCPVCGLEFSRKSSMRRHVLIHIKIRPYHCKDCEKSFYRLDIYKKHLNSKRCKSNVAYNHLLTISQQSPKHQHFTYL